ncbi:MAG: hypothetical protein AAF355_02885 [Myxococcota bacterium]
MSDPSGPFQRSEQNPEHGFSLGFELEIAPLFVGASKRDGIVLNSSQKEYWAAPISKKSIFETPRTVGKLDRKKFDGWALQRTEASSCSTVLELVTRPAIVMGGEREQFDETCAETILLLRHLCRYLRNAGRKGLTQVPLVDWTNALKRDHAVHAQICKYDKDGRSLDLHFITRHLQQEYDSLNLLTEGLIDEKNNPSEDPEPGMVIGPQVTFSISLEAWAGDDSWFRSRVPGREFRQLMDAQGSLESQGSPTGTWEILSPARRIARKLVKRMSTFEERRGNKRRALRKVRGYLAMVCTVLKTEACFLPFRAAGSTSTPKNRYRFLPKNSLSDCFLHCLSDRDRASLKEWASAGGIEETSWLCRREPPEHLMFPYRHLLRKEHHPRAKSNESIRQFLQRAFGLLPGDPQIESLAAQTLRVQEELWPARKQNLASPLMEACFLTPIHSFDALSDFFESTLHIVAKMNGAPSIERRHQVPRGRPPWGWCL